MKSRIFCIAASLLCAASWHASAQTLSVGDSAPPLEVSRWAKGDKLDRLEADRTYVVEFWSTWSGRCRASIPHLTELQKRYRDKGIQFIGVSIWEEDPSKVAPFVKDMGDKMDYAVALDSVPEGDKGGTKGRMAESWMAASGSNGIPTAFLFTRGKIAWIGHPMKLDAPLARVASGNFDLDQAASDYREEKATERRVATVLDKLRKLGRDASDKDRLAVFEEAIRETPSLEKQFGLQIYLLMSQAGDEATSNYGSRLIEKFFKDDAEALNELAWSIVDPEARLEASRRDYKLARKAASRADELTHGENGAILDTLAIALFETGDQAKALEAQEKAVKLMGDADAGVKARLEKYRKAVAEKRP